MPGRFFTPQEDDFIRGLYRQVGESGEPITAEEIAEALGRTPRAIWMRARVLGVSQKNAPRGKPLERFVRAKHKLGWSDSEIRDAWMAMHPGTRCERHGIAELRARLGLPSNRFHQHLRDRVRAKTREQLEKAGLQSLAEVRAKAYRDFAVASGWPEDLRWRETQILNTLWERGPMTRLELLKALGMNVLEDQRKWLSCVSANPNRTSRGSYLANLMHRGLVICLKRAVKTGRRGGNVSLYTLPLDIRRNPPNVTQQDNAGADCAQLCDAVVDDRDARSGARVRQHRRHQGDRQSAGGQSQEGRPAGDEVRLRPGARRHGLQRRDVQPDHQQLRGRQRAA